MNVDNREARGFVSQTITVKNDSGDVVQEETVIGADDFEIDLVDTLPVDGQTITVTNNEVVLAHDRDDAVESLEGGDE